MPKDSSSLGCENVLPNPLDQSHISTMCSQPLFSPESYFDVPIDNPIICDSNVDNGYENNMFNMIDGNVDMFISLDYFYRYDFSLAPYCIYLEDRPRKIL